MAKFNCFSLLTAKKKKDKGDDASSKAGKQKKGRTLQIKLEQPVQPFEGNESKSTTFMVPVPVSFKEDCNVKVINPIGCEAVEQSYEGKDEHEEDASIKRQFSDFDLQACVVNSSEEFDFGTKRVASTDSNQTEAQEDSKYSDWVAFPTPSPSFTRVDEWVRDLEPQVTQPSDDMNPEEGITSPPRSTAHLTRRSEINLSKEILHASSVIQTLNSSSTVAHISGIALKAIPIISAFSSLRSVDLSNNFITHITPGSLPKGIHILNLSRNKISTIEGLRELSRLRVVHLSYNRIARIGHGLSNSTLIKELHLAGNKISDVEGLHRFLKLTVLDLSFNRITTTKALGQLVANYNSLQALNLLGNPVQSNISDDQLRKAVCSLLPKLTYLNKQPIKAQRAREVLTDSVAKAALGSKSRSSRRKLSKRANQVSTSSSVHRSNLGTGQKKKNTSNSRSRLHLSEKSPALAS